MFNFFKKKSAIEIEKESIIKAFKATAKDIRKQKGMYVAVCMDFANYLKQDELFGATGLIWDKHCPHSSSKIGQASLMLLTALKTGTLKDRDDNFLNDLSKYSFELCNLIVTTEEIQPLLNNLDQLKEVKDKKLMAAQNAWNEWYNTDSYTLKSIFGT